MAVPDSGPAPRRPCGDGPPRPVGPRARAAPHDPRPPRRGPRLPVRRLRGLRRRSGAAGHREVPALRLDEGHHRGPGQAGKAPPVLHGPRRRRGGLPRGKGRRAGSGPRAPGRRSVRRRAVAARHQPREQSPGPETLPRLTVTAPPGRQPRRPRHRSLPFGPFAFRRAMPGGDRGEESLAGHAGVGRLGGRRRRNGQIAPGLASRLDSKRGATMDAAGRTRHALRGASRTARQTRSGVAGISTCRTPKPESASQIALTRTPSAGVVPPSPPGRMPCG